MIKSGKTKSLLFKIFVMCYLLSLVSFIDNFVTVSRLLTLLTRQMKQEVDYNVKKIKHYIYNMYDLHAETELHYMPLTAL